MQSLHIAGDGFDLFGGKFFRHVTHHAIRVVTAHDKAARVGLACLLVNESRGFEGIQLGAGIFGMLPGDAWESGRFDTGAGGAMAGQASGDIFVEVAAAIECFTKRQQFFRIFPSAFGRGGWWGLRSIVGGDVGDVSRET